MPLLPAGTDANVAGEQIIEIAKMLRNALDAYIAACDAQSLDAHDFIGEFLLRRLKPRRAQWAAYAAVTGVQANIRTRLPGSFADDNAVTAALATAQNAMDDLITWVETNVQGSLVVAGGWIAIMKVENGALVARTITSAGSLNSLKAELQALRAALSA